jgi:hypothetical protein
MHGILLRALPACLVALAVGCFTTNNEVAPATKSAPAPATVTHAYWQGAAAALSRKPTSGEMKDLVQLVTVQTDALRALSPEGVDPALVQATEEVLRCEEEVLRIAELFNNDAAKLKENQAMALTFADANRKASEAKKRLKALRGPLTERCGAGFAPIG